MKVLISVSNTPNWELLIGCVECQKVYTIENLSDGVEVVTLQEIASLSAIVELLKNPLVDTILVHYQQAEYHIAELVRLECCISDAVNKWHEMASHLIELQKKNRHRIKLVNIEQAATNMRAYSSILNELGIHAVSSDKYSPIEEDMALLAACQSVQQNPPIKKLNDFLQVSSLLLRNDNAVSFDIQSVLKKSQESLVENDKLALEKNTLETQVKNLKAEVSGLLDGTRKLSEYQKTVLSEKEKLTYLYNASKEECSHLLEQLLLVQESLEAYHQTIKALEEKCDEITPLKASLSNAEHENRSLSKSLLKLEQEKSTLVEKLKIEKKEADAHSEKLLKELEEVKDGHSMLEMQLQSVQESLESAFWDRKNLTILQKQSQRTILKLENKLRNTKADLASKNYRLDKLYQEMDDMRRSVFWKAGSPVRAVSKVFNKSKYERKKIEQETELILSSEFFDAQWYLSQYPDVAESTISPAEHYLRFGAKEHRFPGPLFSGDWYTETYPDVAESGMNPLLHYIKFGKAEGRTASVKLLEDKSDTVEYE